MEKRRPFKELEEAVEELRREAQRIHELVWGRRWAPPWRWREGREWRPPLDLYDQEDKLVAEVELPGVDEDTIEVSIIGGTLSIKAERKAPEIREEDYYCCERPAGSFRRDIQLPVEVDVGKVEADYKNGILRITLPKAPAIKPKRVKITIK